MSNQFVIDGLRMKLAEIQTAIRATEQRLRKLASDKATVTAVLCLFDETGDTAGNAALGIQAGAFTRTILDTLRDAEAPLSAREIADKLATRSERPLDKREFGLLVARVRNTLPRISTHLEGDLRDRTTYWRIARQP